MTKQELDTNEFDFEFYSEVDVPDDLRDEAENRLESLAAGHTDITGASVAVEQPAANKGTAFVYEVRVVVYMRPTNMAATETADRVQTTLKKALSAIERQVRDEREKLRTRWKQPQNQNRSPEV